MMPSVFEFVGEFDMWCGFIENGSVIENINNVFFDDFLKIGKVDNHSEFNVVSIRNWRSDYGNRQFITVSVNVFAFAVIAVKRMTGFETELFGDSDVAHFPDWIWPQIYEFYCCETHCPSPD